MVGFKRLCLRRQKLMESMGCDSSLSILVMIKESKRKTKSSLLGQIPLRKMLFIKHKKEMERVK